MVSSSGKKWNKTFSILLLVFLNMRQAVATKKKQVPCYFIFGDSLVDSGNNNHLKTQAKANYPPYGVDYPLGHTGRFTNGRTIADFTAELLGFDKHIPPFATAKREEIIEGVNYGSGGAGILDETGSHLGEVICLDKQLKHHTRTISRLSKVLKGVKKTEKYLRKCYYTVGMGNNDYINNYLVPAHYNSSDIYSPEEFANHLVHRYSFLLKRLYNLGARKVVISGLGNLGRIPRYASRGPAKIDSINKAARVADDKIKGMVDELNNHLAGAKFLFINMTTVSSGDPRPLGIKVLNQPCCKVSKTSLGQCVRGEEACPHRAANAFFDDFHPTEIVNYLTATSVFNATSRVFIGSD